MSKPINIYGRLFSWIFTLGCCLAMMHSCIPVNKIGELADKLKLDADTIGHNLSRGLSNGLDTARLNALAASMVREAGGSLKKELDSLSFQKLQDSLSRAISGVLLDAEVSLEEILNDPERLKVLDEEVSELLANAKTKIDQLTVDLIPGLLSKENQQIIFDFRDELLGDSLAVALERALQQSLKGALKELVEGEELDSLLAKATVVVDSTKDKIDDTVVQVDKTVARVGGILIGVVAALAILFIVLWLRKNAQNKKQRELLVNLTKAIDSIPDQTNYDHTVSFLQNEINASNDPKQVKLLDNILDEYKDLYPEKKKYKNYQQRMVAYLKNRARDRSIGVDWYEDVDDEDFKEYLRKELE